MYFSENQIGLMIAADRSAGYLCPAVTLTKEQEALRKAGSPLPDDIVAALKREASDKALYTMAANVLGYTLSDRVRRQEAVSACKSFLCKRGVITWIKESDDFFLEFLRSEDGSIPEHPLFNPLLRLILSTEYSDMMSIQVASEVFRLLKRFAPQSNTYLEAKCVKEFWKREANNRAADREEISWYMVERIRHDTAHFFRGMKPFVRTLSLNISPNAIQAVCNCKFCKQIALECIEGISNPYISQRTSERICQSLVEDYRNEFRTAFTHTQAVCYSRKTCDTVGADYVIGNAVPKSWKSYRLVAPETVWNYSEQWQVVEWLRDWIENTYFLPGDKLVNHIPIFDQTSQRLRAQEGSVDGSIATVDLSNASDLHRKAALRAILPSEVASAICLHLPRGMMIGERAEVISMVAPMGSPLTFIAMQICIFCILYAATLEVARFNNWDTERRLLALKRIGVVGDDITVDHDVYDTAIDWLTMYGFEVNASKSFNTLGKSIFREACGGDYLNGVDITTHYWPRRPITLSKGRLTYWHVDAYTGKLDDDLSLLIEMSKNIRPFSPSAAVYLNGICRKIEPTLTESPVGDSNPDLWSEFPLAKDKTTTPYARLIRRIKWQWEGWVTGTTEKVFKRNDWVVWKRQPSSLISGFKSPESFDAYVVRNKHRDLTLTEYLTLRKFLSEYEWQSTNRQEWLEEDNAPQGSEGFELTCVPQMTYVMKTPSSTSKCRVERELIRSGVAFSEIVEYMLYQEYLKEGPSYQSELDKLLCVSTRREPESLFGISKLSWKRV